MGSIYTPPAVVLVIDGQSYELGAGDTFTKRLCVEWHDDVDGRVFSAARDMHVTVAEIRP